MIRCTPADTIRKDEEQPDETMNQKEGSVDGNMIIDDNMSNDARNPTNTTSKDKEQTDKAVDQKDGLIDDKMVSNPQTHREVSGDHDTSDVTDDPRRGAGLNDSERRETKPGLTDISPAKGVTGDNMSNDPRNPSYAIRKDGKQIDITKDRKDKFDDNIIRYDNMSNAPHTPADAVEKDKKHTDKTINRKNGVGDVNISNDLRTSADAVGKDKKILDETVDRKDKIVDDNMTNDPRTHKNTVKKIAEFHGGIS